MNRASSTSLRTAIALSLLLCGAANAQDQGADSDIEARLKALEDIIANQQTALAQQKEQLETTIKNQQSSLDAQRAQLDAQYELIKKLQDEQLAQKSSQTPVLKEEPLPPLKADADVVASTDTPNPSDGKAASEAELERRTAAGDDVGSVDAKATLYDPSNTVYDPDFPGAWHLPGTTAAMRIGGFVNLGLIASLDPVLITDRFIVGSIPPSDTNVEGAQTGFDVTASQTRLNFEVREQTAHGEVRAFVEGDFEGTSESFRLRHAFGQFGFLLAGKTWSNFTNVNALPEEVDFEGVNGVVLLRQPQLRIFPEFGTDNKIVLSIEEPKTDVQNGTGSKGSWDLVASLDRIKISENLDWNYQVSFVLRELVGQVKTNGLSEEVSEDTTTGWGITTSGRKTFDAWDDDDFLLWQVTYGKGIGRYLNDLATIGGGDAVFDPEGNLRALPAFAGFVSYRHGWDRLPRFVDSWPGILRSNFTLSWINVENYEFQDDFAYDKTWRASANLLYFPTQNVRLGAEFLWGIRTNKNGSDGDAAQFQFSARYNF